MWAIVDEKNCFLLLLWKSDTDFDERYHNSGVSKTPCIHILLLRSVVMLVCHLPVYKLFTQMQM